MQINAFGLVSCHEAVAHLETLMRNDPNAPSWSFIIYKLWGYTEFDEDVISYAALKPRWSAVWQTSRDDTAVVRLTPPVEIVQALGAFLTQLQSDHIEATGGPLDGIQQYVVCRRTETLLSVIF